MNQSLQGLWPAILLPLSGEGKIDNARALAHGKRMLTAGCDGITLFGSTGEGPAFSTSERKELLEAFLASGVRPDQIIVTITNCVISDAVDLGRHAAALGCHRQMFMPPFYFRHLPDAGIIESVSQVVRGIDDPSLKLLLYHFPALSGVSFSHASISILVQRHPEQVIGVKDSSNDLECSLALIRAFPKLSIMVGAEPQVGITMCSGGAGSINGLGNIAPGLMRRIVSAPTEVTPDDEKLVVALLASFALVPGVPFVSVYKTMLAEQTGDDFWLNVRAPLSPLDSSEALIVRNGYRALKASDRELFSPI